MMKQMNNKEMAELLDKSIKKNAARNRVLIMLTTFSLLVGVYALLSRQDSLIEKNQVLAAQNDSLVVKTDSLEKVTAYTFSEDSLRMVIAAILNTQKSEDTIRKYYAAVMERYYLDSNVSVDQTVATWKSIKGTVNTSHQAVTFSPQDIDISFTGLTGEKPTAVIYVKAQYSKDITKFPATELSYQLKVDTDYKVISIRNLVPKKEVQ
ncbi:hypothetical protein LX64_00276 [Chitinophaga skermanii]|uniref:Uncharacterized protein n=1 Tax=Chitinophaga skermanii TaxID=331697 RepID=A0A327R1X5_9BACT|nr:hypothetical protein [Chitinophaga skermanii]RAJ10670.1 hypothetical protein LX64_00276 [Chitinophaga skermanii]